MNAFLTGMLIVAVMLNFYFIQPLIASDASSRSIPSPYAEGDSNTDSTPKIDIESDQVEKEGQKKVVFVGSVKLIRDSTIKFYADKLIIEVSDSGYMNRIGHIEMIGKVWMTRPGASPIHSQRAQSDNFDLYIDFMEVTRPTITQRLDKLRYWFDSGKISPE